MRLEPHRLLDILINSQTGFFLKHVSIFSTFHDTINCCWINWILSQFLFSLNIIFHPKICHVRNEKWFVNGLSLTSLNLLYTMEIIGIFKLGWIFKRQTHNRQGIWSRFIWTWSRVPRLTNCRWSCQITASSERETLWWDGLFYK